MPDGREENLTEGLNRKKVSQETGGSRKMVNSEASAGNIVVLLVTHRGVPGVEGADSPLVMG